MSTDPAWYFAYGSNLDADTFTGRRGMRPLATRIARLDGHRLCFDIPIGPGERGVANLAHAPGAHTWGVLYLLTPDDFAHLDRTEGVPNGIYQRMTVEVVTAAGDRLRAATYQSPLGGRSRKPSARYMRLLLEGARTHGLPRDWICRLERFELAWDERPDRNPDPRRKEPTMARRTVRFYYAYNSPFAFLANTRLERELAPHDVAVEYRPVYAPRTGGGLDPNSPRIRYIFEDVRRFADAYGITLNPGPFADTKKACLGFFFADAHGRGRAYHDGVYRARWLDAGDIGSDDTLAAVATDAGLDPRAFRDTLAAGAHEAALEQSNLDAQNDGVFGFPFFVYDGQHFWGNDRIEWLVRELQRSS